MSGIEFHQTGYGRRFFDGQLPQLIRAIGRLAEAVEKINGTEDKICTCNSDAYEQCMHYDGDGGCIHPIRKR